MRILRSKRAATEEFVLGQVFIVFIAVTVMIALLWHVHNVGEKPVFEKRYVKADLPLFLDSIAAVPQTESNLFAVYFPKHSPDSLTNFGIKIQANGVVEVSTEKDDRQPGIGYFTPDPSLAMEDRVFPYTGEPVNLIFLKQGSRLYVDNVFDNRQYIREMRSCTGPRFSGSLKAAALPGSPAVQALAQAVQGATAARQGASGIISVTTGNSEDVLIKAYVNGENPFALLMQSQRVGCVLANSVLEYWEKQGVDVKGVAVVPINPLHTASIADDSLAKGAVGVLLEIGTSRRPELFADQPGLVRALVEGVRDA
jgi:hypothetical protein